MGKRANFWAYAPTFEDERHENMRCALEVLALSRALKAANQAGGLPALFPNLTSIAVASIYGSAEHDWWRYEGIFPEGQQADNIDCAELFETFLLSGSTLRHFCTREPGGPLSILPISNPHTRTATANLPTITIHFGLGTNYLLLPVGLPIKWISDIPQSLDWAGQLQEMGTSLNRSLYQRAKHRGGEHKRYKADVEIHFSTPLYGRTRFEATKDIIGLSNPFNLPPSISPPRTLTLDVQRMMASKLGGLLQGVFREYGHPTDSITWRISADTPVCQACLCGPPQ